MATSQLLKHLYSSPKSYPFAPKSSPIFLRSHFHLPPIKSSRFLSIDPKNASFISPKSPSISATKATPLAPILQTLRSLPKLAAATVLLLHLLAARPSASVAASGGRMGGSSFSSSLSSSSTPCSLDSSSYSFDSLPDRYYPPSFSSLVGSSSSCDGSAASLQRYTEIVLCGTVALLLLVWIVDDAREGTIRVVKLQVSLLGMARSLQRDLDQIAETADTSKQEGLNYVLSETTLALLRHPDYCISAYLFVDAKKGIEDAEKCFNQHSTEERIKFGEETLVNVNNNKKRRLVSKNPDDFSNEYIVVTILVVSKGLYELPVIRDIADLKNALKKLGSIPTNKTLAVEVLWTPQLENDALSELELLRNYPLLRPLEDEITAASAR